jgi:hypothetical protein
MERKVTSNIRVTFFSVCLLIFNSHQSSVELAIVHKPVIITGTGVSLTGLALEHGL